MRVGSGILSRLRRSRQTGISALLVFIVGFLALPLAHVANHHNDHDHGFGSHRHHADPDDDDDHEAPDPDHGRGSVEHFGVALTAEFTFVLSVSCAEITLPVAVRLDSPHLDAYQLGPLQPRAPPA